jgi:8-oxo-dGTP pyrophosphatase MutT (NUDIX family)
MAEGIYRQSGAIPFRVTPQGLKVLLVTSSSGKRWVIPKGIVEEGLEPDESAEREALEEAGIKGRLNTPSVGSYQYSKWGGVCEVEVFLLEVLETFEDWQEGDLRERRWCTVDEARSLVEEQTLKEMIGRLPALVQERGIVSPNEPR